MKVQDSKNKTVFFIYLKMAKMQLHGINFRGAICEDKHRLVTYVLCCLTGLADPTRYPGVSG